MSKDLPKLTVTRSDKSLELTFTWRMNVDSSTEPGEFKRFDEKHGNEATKIASDYGVTVLQGIRARLAEDPDDIEMHHESDGFYMEAVAGALVYVYTEIITYTHVLVETDDAGARKWVTKYAEVV